MNAAPISRFILCSWLSLTVFLTPAFAQLDPNASSSEPNKTSDSVYDNVAVLTRVLELIRQDYVDDAKISYHDLTYNALRGMLSGLDPHSQFMEPSSFKDMQEDTNSHYDGLGITITPKENAALAIVTVLENTPAGLAGIKGGDEIRKINGHPIEKMSMSESVAALKGKPNEGITLTIYRPSTKEVRDFTMTRTDIKIESVKDAKLLESEGNNVHFKLGYVRIVQFNQPTAAELGKSLDQLQKEGMNGLILDLRNNPGGLLNSAIDVCGQFLPGNTLVVSTAGRTPSSNKDYYTDASSKSRGNFPIVVLINNGSASGAEIVAGALGDLHRAVLVGERTFGKGSVQSVIQLPDGSAVRLTTAKYYTPSKQVIHEHGVKPTIQVTMTPEQERALLMQHNGLDSGTTNPDPNLENGANAVVAVNDKGDVQLERAVDTLKGMIIYTTLTHLSK